MLAGLLAGFCHRPIVADEAVPADKAILVVRLPADATLTVDDAPTRQTGTERLFQSPSLRAGKKYTYTLKATWKENGRNQSVIRKVGVEPGQRTIVDLTKEKGEAKAPQPRTRTFQFSYAAVVTGLAPGKDAHIWIPAPSTNEEQDIATISQQLPTAGRLGTEKKYGNKILYVDARAGTDGKVPLEVVYQVTRREVQGAVKLSPEDAAGIDQYLQANAKVPVGGKPLELLKDVPVPSEPMAAAHVLYDVVNGHMRYSKDKPGWGQGDAEWACQSGFGNCTDFHSLFMSLARAKKIPVKFEIGFPLPPKRGAGEIPGYHCWAYFHPTGHGWVPVDISEANKNPKLKDYYFGNLTEDRVTFSTGRDLELVPRQNGKPLNFFVYPYVEVDGKPYDKVERKFAFKDLKDGGGNRGPDAASK
jgi:uncharacterized protein (TIGR03000 family)